MVLVAPTRSMRRRGRKKNRKKRNRRKLTHWRRDCRHWPSHDEGMEQGVAYQKRTKAEKENSMKPKPTNKELMVMNELIDEELWLWTKFMVTDIIVDVAHSYRQIRVLTNLRKKFRVMDKLVNEAHGCTQI